MTSGWFRWRAVEDATGRGRELVEVAWLDVRRHPPAHRGACLRARGERIPSRAQWAMDRRRPGDPLDARIRISSASC